MTKKHFIALADALKRIKPKGGDAGRMLQWCMSIDELAYLCECENPRFNRERWIGYINGENTANGKRISS